MHFIVVRQSGKRSGFVIYHSKYIAFTKVKRDAPFVSIRYMKGGPFLSKMVSNRERSWTSGQSLQV